MKIYSLMLSFFILLTLLNCSTFKPKKTQFERFDQYDNQALKSEAYKMEIERAISEFQRKAFKENKDIAELMEKTINMLSRGIMVEQVNIDKIQNTMNVLRKNQVGKVAILQTDNTIEEIFRMADEDFNRAAAYQQEGKLWEAAFIFAQITSMYPVSYTKLDDSYMRLGQIYYQLNLFYSAKEAFTNLLNEIPLSEYFEPGYLMLIRTNYQINRYEDNLREIERFYQRFPSSDSTHLVRYYEGLCSFDLRDFENAKSILSSIPESSPLYFLAYYFTGLSFYQMNDPLAAFYLTQIPRKTSSGQTISDSLYCKALLTAAQIYYDLDSISQAEKTLDAIPNTSYYKDEIAFSRGEILLKLRKFDAAIATFQSVVDEHPHSPYKFQAYNKLLYTYKETNQLTKSDEVYKTLSGMLTSHKYHGKRYDEVLVKLDNRDQELLLLNSRLSLVDLLSYDRFKFLHLADYYNNKYKDASFLNQYIVPTSNQISAINQKIETFTKEKEELEEYLTILTNWEQIEYQNAIINYNKLLQK
ncbi:MAG: outer membrane protein assembly factor BamD [Candidatus Delongbacteria bacterium]|nr:outer membrane protein assembly factor BamD [Candidatus Delongbacteria bacterium]